MSRFVCINKSTHLELTQPHKVVLLCMCMCVWVYVCFFINCEEVDLQLSTSSGIRNRHMCVDFVLCASQLAHRQDGWGPSRLGRVDLGQVDTPSVDSTSGPGHCYTTGPNTNLFCVCACAPRHLRYNTPHTPKSKEICVLCTHVHNHYKAQHSHTYTARTHSFIHLTYK